MAIYSRRFFMLAREYCRHLVCANNFSTAEAGNAKPGYFLHKLISKHKMKVPSDYTYTPCSLGIPSTPRKIQEITRRQKALNAVFMENISDIMFNGEIGEKLRGRGVELTEVRVSFDCTHLSIYWITSLNHTGAVEEIAELLASCSGFLRTELISCQFMGRVPKITFVHDVNFGRATKVQTMIELAYKEIPQEVEDDVTSSESEPVNSTAFSKVPQKTQEQLSPQVPPDMRMDVLGLDHVALMREVTLKMKRTRGELRCSLPEPKMAASALGMVEAVQPSRVAEFIQHQRQKQMMSKKIEQRAERELQKFSTIDKDDKDKDNRAGISVLDNEQDDEYDEEEVTNISYLNSESGDR